MGLRTLRNVALGETWVAGRSGSRWTPVAPGIARGKLEARALVA